jgi:CheY-like chemotaxis protein
MDVDGLTGRGRPERILLVGDNRSDFALIRSALPEGGCGCTVETVPRLADALLRLAEDAPDCLLLDLALPEADGLRSIARLVDRSPDLPIVLLTGPSTGR